MRFLAREFLVYHVCDNACTSTMVFPPCQKSPVSRQAVRRSLRLLFASSAFFSAFRNFLLITKLNVHRKFLLTSFYHSALSSFVSHPLSTSIATSSDLSSSSSQRNENFQITDASVYPDICAVNLVSDDVLQ